METRKLAGLYSEGFELQTITFVYLLEQLIHSGVDFRMVTVSSFIADRDAIAGTYSLAYYGNQHQSSRLIAGLKSGNVALAGVGQAAGSLGNVISAFTIFDTGRQLQTGQISTPRAAFRLTGVAASFAAGTFGGPAAGAAAGVLFTGGELGHDLVRDFGDFVNSNVESPSFIPQIMETFGVPRAIRGF